MQSLTIGEVARHSGLRPSAIRYYESLGILPEPERVSGRRRYDPDVLHLLNAINIAKQAGLTMTEMQHLFQGVRNREAPSALWETFARRKLQEVDDLIVELRSMKRLLEEGLRCGCLGLEECVIFGHSAAPRQSEP